MHLCVPRLAGIRTARRVLLTELARALNLDVHDRTSCVRAKVRTLRIRWLSWSTRL